MEDNIDYLHEIGFAENSSGILQNGNMYVNLKWGEGHAMLYIREAGSILLSATFSKNQVLRDVFSQFVKDVKMDSLNSMAQIISAIQKSPSF